MEISFGVSEVFRDFVLGFESDEILVLIFGFDCSELVDTDVFGFCLESGLTGSTVIGRETSDSEGVETVSFDSGVFSSIYIAFAVIVSVVGSEDTSVLDVSEVLSVASVVVMIAISVKSEVYAFSVISSVAIDKDEPEVSSVEREE